jgi:hypothetical protein
MEGSMVVAIVGVAAQREEVSVGARPAIPWRERSWSEEAPALDRLQKMGGGW